MSLIKKFASVGSATMASRVLGFVREALIAAALGAGPVTDAFYAAFRFPNLFRRLFAEGAFNTAFIPLFAKEMEGGGVKAAQKFGEDVLAVLVTVLLLLSALAMIFMPFLVATVVAPGFADTPEKFDLTVVMTQIMFPYLFCMSLVAMMSGIMNSMRKFFLAALVPVLLNVILIAVLATALLADFAPREAGIWLAWGVFISGFAQLGILAFAVRAHGFGMRLHFPRMTPAVKRLMVLMGPALLTGGIMQINLLVGQIIASQQDKAISFLNFADRINQLPLGVIGIAVGVVLLPELARALKAGDTKDAQHLQNRSLEFALGLTVPAAVGLIVMPAAIVSLLFERGAFTPEDTQMTALALAAICHGPSRLCADQGLPAGLFCTRGHEDTHVVFAGDGRGEYRFEPRALSRTRPCRDRAGDLAVGLAQCGSARFHAVATRLFPPLSGDDAARGDDPFCKPRDGWRHLAAAELGRPPYRGRQSARAHPHSVGDHRCCRCHLYRPGCCNGWHQQKRACRADAPQKAQHLIEMGTSSISHSNCHMAQRSAFRGFS